MISFPRIPLAKDCRFLFVIPLLLSGCGGGDESSESAPIPKAEKSLSPSLQNRSSLDRGSLERSRLKNSIKNDVPRLGTNTPRLQEAQRLNAERRLLNLRERDTLLNLQTRSLAERLGRGIERPIDDDTREPPPARGASPIPSLGRANPNLRTAHGRPWSSLCRIEAKFSGGIDEGTGVLISPRCLLTAGHVLFNDSLGGQAESFVITPDYLGPNTAAPYGSLTISGSAAHVAEDWQTIGKPVPSPFDYGVIVLNRNLGDEVGTMRIGSDEEVLRTGLDVWLGGFPVERQNNATRIMVPNRMGLLQSHGPVRYDSAQELSYTIDSSEGQSGAPLFVFDSNDPSQAIIIGVHTYGAEEERRNLGLRITPRVRRFIAQYSSST